MKGLGALMHALMGNSIVKLFPKEATCPFSLITVTPKEQRLQKKPYLLHLFINWETQS